MNLQYPNSALILADLAFAHVQLSEHSQAVACMDGALALADSRELRMIRAIVEVPMVLEGPYSLNDFDNALDAWANTQDSPGIFPFTLFPLAYKYGNHTDRLKTYASGFFYDQDIEIMPPQRKRKKLMIVFSVRYFSVWSMILEGILTYVNRELFEVVLLPMDAVNNPISERIAVAAQAMSDIYYHPMDNAGSALDYIRYQQPDILYYPELGMDATAYWLGLQRLAPLQVASWGHPITTGLASIDIFFSGELIEPGNAQQHYSERLVKLPGTGAITLSPKPLDDYYIGFNPDIPKFALCQSPQKFDPADDEIYIRIAKELGRCEFWLPIMKGVNCEKLKDRMFNAFTAAGLNPLDYLFYFPALPDMQFAALLRELDVYLDCPAFSGFTTAHIAIQQGIPIVTLEGEFMRQRLAAGLLRQIGITDTIAHSRGEYVEIAVRLAKESNTDRTERRKAIINASVKADNNVAVVRAFEAALLNGLEEKEANHCIGKLTAFALGDIYLTEAEFQDAQDRLNALLPDL